MEIYFIQHSEIHPGWIICKASRVNPHGESDPALLCCKDAVERLPSREGTEWNHTPCLSPMLFLILTFFPAEAVTRCSPMWAKTLFLLACVCFLSLLFNVNVFLRICPCSVPVLPSMLCIPFKLELMLMSPSPFVLRSEHVSKIVISVCVIRVCVLSMWAFLGR